MPAHLQAAAKAPEQRRDALLIAGLALLLRALVVLWAKDRFPPADDGAFYHVVAERIAKGAGYTWLWPDGAVTYAAHYPVGYPALLGLAYALFGAHPVVAMAFNAGLGAWAVFAAQRAASRFGTRAQAACAALLIALHPGLVFYTPALMTEGIAAELLVIALWLTLRVGSGRGENWRFFWLALCCACLTLIRPQLLEMAPVFGFFAIATHETRLHRRCLRSLALTALSLALCLPWTLRNCARMDRCVFVSANGGWNLLIGALPEGDGAWISIDGSRVPSECRNVFGEAEKDRCFGQAGLARIRHDPWAFARLVPRKLSTTFDYFGAPGHYLRASNGHQFDDRDQLRLGIAETIWERLILLGAIAQAARLRVRRRGLMLITALPSALFALTRSGYLGYLGYALTVALSAKQLLKNPLHAIAAASILTTAATHALFFGAGRYGFVCAALLCVALAGPRWRGKERSRPSSAEPDGAQIPAH